VLTPEDLLRRLAHDVLPSIVALRDVPERQQTINATVAWSYQLLDESEQRAFRRFGALPGLFPIDAAAAVLAGRESASVEDKPLRAVAGLIDKSLLARAETSVVATRPLYQMLETVRSFAALELASCGERDDAVEGLVRYCTEEASLATSGLVGPAQVEWLDHVREDLESYRCALAWLIERGRPAEAVDIAWGLIWFWVIRGHISEGLRWYEQALALPSLPPAAEAKALLGAGMLGYPQGDLDRARGRLTRARAVTGDVEIVAHSENVLGHVELAAGNMQVARDCFARSNDGFRALGIPWGTGHTLTAMAWVALESGDIGQAEGLLNEATSGLRHAGPWFLSLTRYLRALVAVRRGHPDEAIAWVRESLTHIRQLHDKFAFVYALVPLAAASALKGDDAWSASILGAQDALTETTGARVVEASANELQERVEREARARLGPERWAQAYAAGRKSSIDVLLKDIDRARA